jgi:hypothetical protein
MQSRAPRPIVEADIERRLGLDPGSVASILASLRGQAVALGDNQSWTTKEATHRLVEAAVGSLERYHEQTPHELGAPLETLRTSLARLGGQQAAAHALEIALDSGRIQAVDSGRVCLPEFAEQSAKAHDLALELVRAALAAVALDGASEQELAERAHLSLDRARAALARLAKMEQARRLSGMWFLEARLASLRDAVRAHLRSHTTMSVPMFKQLFSVSRKQAIPLLEDLDHQGVTMRKGDERVPGPAKDR